MGFSRCRRSEREFREILLRLLGIAPYCLCYSALQFLGDFKLRVFAQLGCNQGKPLRKVKPLRNFPCFRIARVSRHYRTVASSSEICSSEQQDVRGFKRRKMCCNLLTFTDGFGFVRFAQQEIRSLERFLAYPAPKPAVHSWLLRGIGNVRPKPALSEFYP